MAQRFSILFIYNIFIQNATLTHLAELSNIVN